MDPKRRAIVDIMASVAAKPTHTLEDIVLLQVAQIESNLLMVDALKELMQDAHESESLHNRVRKIRRRSSGNGQP